MFSLKLDRAQEMLLGAALPGLLLIVNEFILFRPKESNDYLRYVASKTNRQQNLPEETPEEKSAILKQNLFGLRVISFAMAFTALLLVGISFVSTSGKMMVLGIAAGIFLAAVIPLRASRKVKIQLASTSPHVAPI